MSEEEKFDELLSSKLSERDFPFDELNWDEAERLIIKQERWRKIFRFILIFSVGLAVGIAIMLPFAMNTRNVLPDKVVAKANQNGASQNTISEPAVQSQAIVTNANSNEDKSPLPVQSALVIDTRTGRGASSNISSIAKSIAEKQPVVITDASNKLPSKANEIASTNVTSKEPGKKATINYKEVNVTGQATNASSTQNANNVIAGNIAALNNSNKTTENAWVNSTEANNAVPNNNIASNNSALLNDTNKSTKNSMTNSVVKNNTANAPYDSASNATKNYTNNANSPPMLRVDQPISDNSYSKNILSVYAGGNYSLGWNGGDAGEKEANGITPWGEIDFTHYFTNNIAVSLGAGYTELSNLNQTYTSSVIQYDFGANANTTNVTPKTAYYIAFPVALKYNIDDKDMIGIGCDYLLLLTTSSTLTTYQQSYFSQSQGTSEKQNGYTQGFSNSDIELTFSYSRMLTDRFGISIELYHDLGYIENGLVPDLYQSGKNNGFRLALSYQLMK